MFCIQKNTKIGGWILDYHVHNFQFQTFHPIVEAHGGPRSLGPHAFFLWPWRLQDFKAHAALPRTNSTKNAKMACCLKMPWSNYLRCFCVACSPSCCCTLSKCDMIVLNHPQPRSCSASKGVPPSSHNSWVSRRRLSINLFVLINLRCFKGTKTWKS